MIQNWWEWNSTTESIVTSNDETSTVKPWQIDLTQFEGTIAEGKWHEHIHEPKEDGYERVASIVVSGVVAPPYTLQTNEEYTFATVEMGDLTAHLPLFMMVPDLIAELKKCYGLIDELLSGSWLHHTVLENEDYMDLMVRMGVFECEDE